MVGKAAVSAAAAGESGKMMTLDRTSNDPYTCRAGMGEIDKIANLVRTVPDEYINERGNGITDEGLRYILPLIEGEVTQRYEHGLPVHIEIKR